MMGHGRTLRCLTRSYRNLVGFVGLSWVYSELKRFLRLDRFEDLRAYKALKGPLRALYVDSGPL